MKLIACVVVFLSLLTIWFSLPEESSVKQVGTWQQMANPGKLSQAHAFLENDCAACHTPVKGVEARNCVACHANNHELLNRQPTAFHADVNECGVCHVEHRGRKNKPSLMDHSAISKIGLGLLEKSPDDSAGKLLMLQMNGWIKHSGQANDFHPQVKPSERVLNCASCHSNDDVHVSYFGEDCASCHSTNKWSIPSFRHPPSKSTSCSQCHQAPPSHYMKHFNMISAKVAGKPKAKVDQCYACHQTTSWNDIIDVGYYKHH